MRVHARIAILLLVLGGCSDNTTDPANPERIDGILVNHTDPATLVAAHLEALTARSAAAYEELLERPEAGRGATGFRYVLREQDAREIPWVTDGSWNWEAERRIVANLADAGFAGGEPPVEAIVAGADLVKVEPVGDGFRQTVDAGVQVLLGPDTGWIAVTRLEIEMHPDADGFLRIREIAEVGLEPRVAPEGLESTSLGALKARYRWADPSEVTIDGIRVNHTNADEAIAAHFQALDARNAAAYEALLKEDFRFYIRVDDVDLFPWLTDGWWDHATEVAIIRNMTDPDYRGEELPVQSIEGAYDVVRVFQGGEGLAYVLSVVVQVLVGPDTGWIATTALWIETCLDDDGFWRIARIEEFDPFAGREALSFGQIKGLYR